MNRNPILTAKDAAALQEFLREVRTALGANVAEIKLFGSKATGRNQPDSDIDILVALNHGSVEAEDRVLDIAFNVHRGSAKALPRAFEKRQKGDYGDFSEENRVREVLDCDSSYLLRASSRFADKTPSRHRLHLGL